MNRKYLDDIGVKERPDTWLEMIVDSLSGKKKEEYMDLTIERPGIWTIQVCYGYMKD